MQKKLFYFLTATLFFLFLFPSCIKKSSEKDVEQSLTVAMNKYLNDHQKVDTTKVKFNVVSVIFFEDKKYYRCEYKIHLKSPTKDTTGIMTADVSKDFERVMRKS